MTLITVHEDIQKMIEKKKKQSEMDGNYAQATLLMRSYLRFMIGLRKQPSAQIQRKYVFFIVQFVALGCSIA